MDSNDQVLSRLSVTECFVPTPQLRWHKHVHSMVWSTKWDEVYTMTLQQLWACSFTEKQEWRDIPEYKTEEKDMNCYG